MDFGYFHEEESEQFAFYRIPQVLFKDEKFAKLSTDAKVLYGLFLNRVSLSKKNHWIDEEGRVYVYYTLVSIQEDLHCASQKALKLLKELESYGLIERVKQGLCKPDRIYVKNFLDTKSLRFLTRKNSDSGLGDVPGLGSEKLRCNNTENNNTEIIDTNLISSTDERRKDERSQYRQYFMEELAIDIMKERYPYDKDVIDEILELILDTVCSTRKTIGIAGEQRPIDIVKSRFMKLDSGHLEFVLQSMSDNTTLIRNMKQYLLAALYNAPLTMNNYYKSLVKHDMASRII